MGCVTIEAARQRLLECLAAGMRVSEAAAAAGLSRSRAYELRTKDAAFAAAWQAALEVGRPSPSALPPFDPAHIGDGRLALLLHCHPPEEAPWQFPVPAATPGRSATATAKTAFLGGIEAGLTISQAARAAGLSRGWIYVLKARDPAFAAAWDEVAAAVAGAAEFEARRRVFGGLSVLSGDATPASALHDATSDRLLIALHTRIDRSGMIRRATRARAGAT